MEGFIVFFFGFEIYEEHKLEECQGCRIRICILPLLWYTILRGRSVKDAVFGFVSYLYSSTSFYDYSKNITNRQTYISTRMSF